MHCWALKGNLGSCAYLIINPMTEHFDDTVHIGDLP